MSFQGPSWVTPSLGTVAVGWRQCRNEARRITLRFNDVLRTRVTDTELDK